MPTSNSQRVRELLHRMATEGLPAAKRLFWTELNYDHVDERLSTRDWPQGVQELIHEAPHLLARYASSLGNFDILYIKLSGEQSGRNFPLSIAAERQVVAQLLPDHPYALFVFSDPTERHWHLVNLKYQREKPHKGEPTGAAQQVFRRIAIGPHERLRTAAERIALLDLAALSPSLSGLSPIAIQQRHDEAFDVEAVTRAFFTAYRERFEAAEVRITGLDDSDALRIFTQRLFNRLLFIVFLERKGWLTYQGRSDYLQALWEDHCTERSDNPEANFYRDRLTLLFFSGLNSPQSVDIAGIHPRSFVRGRIGDVPYLNGGLFEREALDERTGITVPDAVFDPLFDDLLYHYNFTVTESTPLDVEVAVDPEMLGKIFEELVTGRHETGSYYTPKPVVAFMCREALKGYLRERCPGEAGETVSAFVEQRDARDLRQPEAVLAALRGVKVCDPACGSGAYLLGMLHELMELRQALFVSRQLDAASAYKRKLEIIQRNLYGVDIDPFAVNIGRLRLWLSLIVDFEGGTPLPLPNLEFKIETGDSLTAPAPAPLQPDLFRQQDVARFFELKGAFMQAHGSGKRSLKEEIAALKTAIASWASEESGEGAFDWAVDFAEVFTPAPTPGAEENGRGGGFDIIVANPPYVRQELLGKELKEVLKRRYPDVYTGTADLYVYFYARTIELLRRGGVASFITSNKWLRAGYGKKLRQHLNEATSVQTIVDFGDLPVFEAVAYPQVIIFRKAEPPEGHTVRALTVDDLSAVDHLGEVVEAEAWEQPRTSLRANGWTLLKPDILLLMQKLRKIGVSLREYVKGEFYRGLVTGYNQAFELTQAQRDTLTATDPQSASIIKPWIRGRNIKRWHVEWDNKYLIFTRRGIDIDQYPAIKTHLSKFKERLTPGIAGGRKPGSYAWYEIQDTIAYFEDFDKPKIIYQEIATHQAFAYSDRPLYLNNKCFFIPTNNLYLLGLLNSKVVWFFLGHVVSKLQHDAYAMQSPYIEQIPIPEPTSEQKAAIEACVERLLALHQQGTPPEDQVAALEAELNAHVYAVYGLTREEIALVEGES